jgi:hypothetical protein
MGIRDVVEGAKAIKGSEIADAYRRFADEYDANTQLLPKMLQ